MKKILDIDGIEKEQMEYIDRFQNEVNQVYSTLVLPSWGGELHGYPHTIWGYMMLVFARIDLLSMYWRGESNKRSQTSRMVDFMATYISKDREACNSAIRIWRHKLMHTSEPRPFKDSSTGVVYRWLLHWGPELPPDGHFTFSITSDSRILNIGLVYLLHDLRKGVERYLQELKNDSTLQRNYAIIHEAMSELH